MFYLVHNSDAKSAITNGIRQSIQFLAGMGVLSVALLMEKKGFVTILIVTISSIYENIVLKIAKMSDSFLLIFIFRQKIPALNMMGNSTLCQLDFVRA